ncbi:MAG: hypothetical protein A2Z12_01415 [Actinobacteria bacterium RBG_16_68_21]|nr:MAG: hypothetical protein A2Z12_01415 [Actinobacteria bacterium RBG_16_68_21]
MMVMRRVSVGLICLLLIAAGACGNDDAGGFDEAFRQSFMASCTASQPTAFCSCYLDELEQRYTQEEIYAVAIAGSETPPQEFIDAGLVCVVDLGG